MNNEKLLKQVLEMLMALKASLHDTAEPGISEKLDEAISEIQLLIESGDNSQQAYKKALICLGWVFEKIPSVAALLKLFSD